MSIKKAIIFMIAFFADVGSTGEMSNQIFEDLMKIYKVATSIGM